jgi:hypothetical protein
LAAFADFVDPLLAVKAAVTDPAQTPDSIARIAVKREIKKEEEELDYSASETPLPAKRRRTTVTTTVNITPKTAKRSRSKASPVVKKEQMTTITMEEAALAYPTPPATPASVKLEQRSREDSPTSLAERTKLRSSLRRSASARKF